MRRRRAVVSMAAAVLLTSCAGSDDGQDGEVVDFGDAAPTEESPELPADDGLDVADAPPAEAPARDARLVPGGWPEAAAFVAREADEGRPTIVNIFASWCGPCRSEMPLLTEASQEHEDVAFLGIDHLDALADGEAFVDEFDVDFPTLHDLDGDVADAVGARAMPTTVAFDRDGRLAARVFGEVTESELDELLGAIQ